LEYKQDPRDGGYKLLDVNARTWGYHTLGPAAGVDFTHLLYRDQLGLPVQQVTARPGVRWDPAADRRAERGPRHPGRDTRVGPYLRSLRGISTEAVFSPRDPLPGLYELALCRTSPPRGACDAVEFGGDRPCLSPHNPTRSSTTSGFPTKPSQASGPWLKPVAA
jgi:hypothetical protein